MKSLPSHVLGRQSLKNWPRSLCFSSGFLSFSLSDNSTDNDLVSTMSTPRLKHCTSRLPWGTDIEQWNSHVLDRAKWSPVLEAGKTSSSTTRFICPKTEDLITPISISFSPLINYFYDLLCNWMWLSWHYFLFQLAFQSLFGCLLCQILACSCVSTFTTALALRFFPN